MRRQEDSALVADIVPEHIGKEMAVKVLGASATEEASGEVHGQAMGFDPNIDLSKKVKWSLMRRFIKKLNSTEKQHQELLRRLDVQDVLLSEMRRSWALPKDVPNGLASEMSLENYKPRRASVTSAAEAAQAEAAKKVPQSPQTEDIQKFRRDPSMRSAKKGEESSCLSKLVKHRLFESFFGVVVLTNAIFIGIDVDLSARETSRPMALRVMQYIYAVLFTSELLLRLCAAGGHFLRTEDWAWNLLDVPLTSILHTMKALVWALFLLLLIVYVFAVLFTQVISDYFENGGHMTGPELDAAQRYFGSLTDAFAEEERNDQRQADMEHDENKHIGTGGLVLCFLGYMSFTYFCVLNVVTAVFCQSAIESAQNDQITMMQAMLMNKEQHLQSLDVQQYGWPLWKQRTSKT
eukprot:g11818.t1